MLRNETTTKLHEMRLGVMAKAFNEQVNDSQYNSLSFEDRFGFLVDTEWASRKSNLLMRLIKNSTYSIHGACVENIEYRPGRNLDKSQMLRLSTCTYIQSSQNIILLGATGAGKSYLACALGNAANRNFYSVKYIRLPDLLVDIALSRADGTYREFMKKYKKVKLLILDEWLLYSLNENEARDLLELVEARSRISSTIYCSQFDIPGWHAHLYDATLADAIVDRIIHNAHIVRVEGDSMRKRKGLTE